VAHHPRRHPRRVARRIHGAGPAVPQPAQHGRAAAPLRADPAGPHAIKDTDKGRQTILAAIRRKPYIGAWAEFATDTGPSLTATLDVAPATGELLVAVRQWNGIASVGTTPTGWTRVAVATSTGASPRTVAIETKTSDGTEGTALTFATTGTAVQSLAAPSWSTR
jgi:hypothetical protein